VDFAAKAVADIALMVMIRKRIRLKRIIRNKKSRLIAALI